MFKNSAFVLVPLMIYSVNPITLQEGEEIKENNIDGSQLNQCLSDRRGVEVGVCFGKELLNKLNRYDEAESFSLATGLELVRDEKTPRDIGSFLDKDPMDFRSIIEDASNLISKRSLHWDMSMIYPGLTMRIGPTLANGVLEFVMDPKLKDRAYNGQYQQHGEISTGRLLARNLLVPFLLGFKFQLSTLLPLLLGFVLLASKKAFLIAKLAFLAVTVFGGAGSSGYGSSGGLSDYGSPALSSYTSLDHPSFLHGQTSGGLHHHRPHFGESYYREKSDVTTGAPITPVELRDRLERLFITKKDIEDSSREQTKVRNARNFAWTPINSG
ncbi:uncharacterized protein LOC105391597 [Plutella xylostella]|uniref:uncharacterized protein LOC105391597 n=1 Tax=Plutella xylostella TaxID=51655 RepID=UPI002032CD33|nr:uncharacterized protein LOC105391597 [Plutella xylostella]